MNYVSAFLTALVNGGIQPKNTKDITESHRFKRIAVPSDKAGKRSMSYWLRIEHDFAYGYAKDFKTGLEVRFKSHDPNLTKTDLARVKAIIKARQAEEDARIAERHAKIAARAKVVWAAAKTGGATPYLIRKKISIGNAKRNDDVLIVPIMDGADLVNWQIIRGNGTKKFPFGGKKQGCYSLLGTIDPTKPIYICEGWATGRSIQDALDTGNVVVAFDAGNLLPVGKNIRKIYTNTAIIFAADNDENQVGQNAANKAVKSVSNSTVKYPNVKNTDFNDIEHDLIRSILCPPASSPDGVISLMDDNVQAIGGDWRNSLLRDHKGRLVGSSLSNAIVFLQNADELSEVFAYDEFKQAILVKKCPPWGDAKKFKVDRITDDDFTCATAYLEHHEILIGFEKTARAISVASKANSFHSARIYFDALEWDGQYRLKNMFKEHFGCKSEDAGYLAWVAQKWMTAAVKRLYEPGCKFDHVLVMESVLQGTGKSTALKNLVTFGEDETETYHTDAIGVNDCTATYTSLKMQGVMIVELAELKGFSKQDDETIKNWLTQTFDEVKLPFDRMTNRFKRQFIFAATTNKHDYLKDPTGNRRYWPITIEKIIDQEKLAAERMQLWAEAVHLYKSGLYIGPTVEENDQADIERQKRLSHDAWTDTVMTIVEKIDLDEFKTSQILDKMDLKLMDKNDNAQRRISNILQMNGFENISAWCKKSKKNVRLWSRKS